MDHIFSDRIERRLAPLLRPDSLVPASHLRRLLSGKIDPTTGKDSEAHGYSAREKVLFIELAAKEAQHIEKLSSHERPVWFSSAGGSGSGKTTALLQQMAMQYKIGFSGSLWRAPNLSPVTDAIFRQADFVWVSPDHGALVTIGKSLQQSGKFKPDYNEAFYMKYRWASNFLSNHALSVAFVGRKNVAHDTTLGSLHAVANLEKARAAGYFVTVQVIGTPLDMRAEAANRRNASFFQSLPYNVVEQDRVFGQNLPAIVECANQLRVMWRDASDEAAFPVALIKENRTLAVKDEDGFERFVDLYPAMKPIVERLTRDDEVRGDLSRILKEQRGRHASSPGFRPM